jgi:hypothetical protein
VPRRLSSNLPSSEYEVLGRSRGRARSFILFNFIPIAFHGLPRRAYDRAVNRLGGDDLINPVIYESWCWIMFFGTIYSTKG